MSLKKVEEIKSGKGFKIADLIVYAVILLAVGAVFAGVLLSRDGSELSGVRVKYKNEVIFTYEFSSGEMFADEKYCTVSDGDKIAVKIEVEEGYNLLEIEKSPRRARITQSDCSRGDCTYSSANKTEISGNGSVIFCSPHSLSVEPLGYGTNDPVVKV